MKSTSGDTMPYERQQSILRKISVDLHNTLDVDQIYPNLCQHNLLNDTEQEQFQSSNLSLTRRQKASRFATSLPRKGTDALSRFVTCLDSSTEGTGTAHAQLASRIREELVNSHKEEVRNSKLCVD